MQGEAFDFFILYTAWMTRQDVAMQRERAVRGEAATPMRNVLSIEHEETEGGEALMHGDQSHTTQHGTNNGSSKSLHDALGHAAPGAFILAGITLTEHVCKPGTGGYALVNVAFISERTTERTNAPTHKTWLSEEIQGPGLSGEIHGRYGHGTDAYPRENCIAPDTHTLYSRLYMYPHEMER